MEIKERKSWDENGTWYCIYEYHVIEHRQLKIRQITGFGDTEDEAIADCESQIELNYREYKYD